MKKVLITGSTGMVGRGVLYECLDDDRIKEIILVNRNPLNIEYPKIQEILLKDFTKVDSIKNKLGGIHACFYCMGVSSFRMKEEQFNAITYDTTKAFADTLFELNPNMIFNYVSGTGTDSSEKSNTMWARVKGKTENYVLQKGFTDAYMFRPGAIVPEKGIKSRTKLYSFIYMLSRPFFGLMKKAKSVTTTTKIGLAMINTLFHPQELKHLEGKDINLLASKS